MTLINKRVFFLAAMTAIAGVVFAQTGVSLETEIQNLEKAAAKQGVSPLERHDSLVRLARLRQLSGDIEGAAKNWLEAAAAIPGQIDDDALLACAYCLAAMGELDRARTALDPLLAKSIRARFLNIGIYTISTGNTSALASIADNPEYSQMKSEIFFLLWRTLRANSGDTLAAEKWRQRLVAEFPQSPEGRLAAGGATDSPDSIVIKTNPFWLFLGGLDSLPVMGSETVGRPVTSAASVQLEHTAGTAQPAVSSQQGTGVSQTVRLQTGLFSRQANAQAQAASLKQAGFSSSMIEQRIVNNSEMWAVIVSSETDANAAIRALRDAGFEAFPLR
ncbi:MAG: SPOR domain-containing protein [Treponema sp.]|jgi:tetratricopeptide (TPR) repeat protein|nr:SPOR domain-containing protein [Treponema sp.]